MRSLLLLAFLPVVCAQPVKLRFQCTAEDIHAGGLACTEEEPCAVYLELSALEPVGSQAFLIGNIHSQTTTLYALLLASADGGKTWREPIERLPDASLDHIRFADFEYGWISGQPLHPLPHDPFVLLTNDGGKTWRRQPVFDEPRAGSVLQMWFESRGSGSMVIDRGQSTEGMRYELYESLTGGESWMIREAAERPIPIKRMPVSPANTDWRIRPDGASKTFRIEKREAGKWHLLSSFLISLDPCKPPPPPAEPPPEAAPPDEAKPPADPAPARPKPSLKRPPAPK
ncbi:MAG: hypothetical protein HYR60_22970 [Acidobacteria bacterium]|nr:hypothetical protein [Acidobacteriota bacterium]MBI3469995.1 hypothetical protein [Candidatus Solibacter usitatus]